LSRLVTIPHVGLPNIVGDKAVVKEFFQDDVNAQNLSRELFDLIDNQQYRNQVVSGLESVRENLGEGGSARNMARLVLSMIETEQ
jgi:lipid-A-disaccharide synthase